MKRILMGVFVLSFLLVGIVSANEKCCGTCKVKAVAAKKAEYPKAAVAKKAECPKAAVAKKAECPKAAAAAKKCCGTCQAKAKADCPKAAAAKKAECPKAVAAKKCCGTCQAKLKAKAHDHAEAHHAGRDHHVDIQKLHLAKIAQLLRRIQNIAREEKAEKTVAAIDNAIKHHAQMVRKHVAAKKDCCGTCKAKDCDDEDDEDCDDDEDDDEE